MAKKTSKIKVAGLSSEITEQQVTLVFQNSKRQGGGPIKNVELSKQNDTSCAVITFEESDAVDCIMGKGKEVVILGCSVTIEPIYDSEEEDSEPQKLKEKQNDRLKSYSRKNAETSSDSEEQDADHPVETKSKRFAKKKELKENKTQSRDEVGDDENTKPLKSSRISHRKVKSASSDYTDRRSVSVTQGCEDTDLTDEENKMLSKPRRNSSGQLKSISRDDAKKVKQKLNDESGKLTSESTKKMRETAQALGQESPVPTENLEPWETTIKATVIDITKSKDSFLLCFEDPNITQGEFYDKSLLLDGLNKLLYVTFHTRHDALALTRLIHGVDSNISKVTMAEEEDFNTYLNLMSIHGYKLDSEEKKHLLQEFIEEKTSLEVIEILQEDEPKSAIIVFNHENCEDITEATWQCATLYNNVRLITAPVAKSHCMRVSRLNPQTTDLTLQRYMANKKRSGGGNVKSLKRLSETEAIVCFEDEESWDEVLTKEHELEDYKLLLSVHHPCLTKETLQERIASQIRTQAMPKKKENVIAQQSKPLITQQRSAEETAVQSHPNYSLENLNFKVEKLYYAAVVTTYRKAFQGTIRLAKFGYNYVKNYLEEALNTIAGDENCSFAFLHNNKVILKLNWPSKLTVEQVKSKLQTCLDRIEDNLKIFNIVKCIIDETFIFEFQQFCQTRSKQELNNIEVYFDHSTSEAVMISAIDTGLMKNALNRAYQTFLSQKSLANIADPKWHLPSDLKKEKKTGNQRYEDKEFDRHEKEPLLHRPAHHSQANLLTTGKKMELENDNAQLPFRETRYTGQPKQKSAKTKDHEHKYAAYKESREETFDEKDLILFDVANICHYLEEKFKPLKIDLELEDKKVVVRGNNKTSVDSAILELFKESRNYMSLSNFRKFSQEQLKLLGNQNVCKQINSLFKEQDCQAHFQCMKDSLSLHYVKGTDTVRLQQILESFVVLKKKILDADAVLLLESEKGQRFLADLSHQHDGVKINSDVKLNSHEKYLLVIAPATHHDLLSLSIDHFLENNKLLTKEVYFPKGMHLFLQKFLNDQLNEIEKVLLAKGTKLKKMPGKYELKGQKDGVQEGEQKLNQLSSKIDSQEDVLKYFGIKEYLQDSDGKALIRKIEESQSCVIIHGEKTGSGPIKSGTPVKAPTAVACTKVKDCNISFMHGDISGLEVDVIVNALDSSLQCDRGLGKALLSKGGHSIQEEIDKANGGTSEGTVIQTSAGRLQTCQALFHVVCPVFKAEVEVTNLERAILACLKHAEKQKFKSIAFPVLGIGKIFQFPSIAACKTIVRTLLTYVKDTSLSNIYLCDMQTEIVDQLIERCEALSGQEIERLEDSSVSKAPPPMRNTPPRVKNFKHIKVKVIAGEITKSKTDVIVITADRSLNLTKGRIAKTLLKYGGEALQQELNATYGGEGIKPGEIAQSSGGDLECNNILYAVLPHYKENSSFQLSKQVLRILDDTEKLQATSISIPAIGTGNLGYPAALSADEITDAISKYAHTHPQTNLKTVNLIVYHKDTEVLQAFKAVVEGQTDQGHSKDVRGAGYMSRDRGHFESKGADYMSRDRGHFESKDHKSPPLLIKVSEEVRVKLYAEGADKIRSAIKELNDELKKAFKEAKEKSTHFKKLKWQQVKHLEEQGFRNCIRVSVNVEEGLVIMQSFNKDGLLQVHKELAQMEKDVIEEHYRSLQMAVVAAIKWQFEDGKKWRDFEPIINSELEREYKKKAKNYIVSDARGRKFLIDFSSMEETQVDESGSPVGTTIKVRRYDKTKEGEPLPRRWDRMNPNENLKIVNIQPSSEEFKKVQALFSQGVHGQTIKKLERIQNRSLYQQYKAKKRELERRNPKGHKNEQTLFHGTSPETVAAINETGFNRSYCGKNGTAYGNGVYFAVSSATSVGYARADTQGFRKMYQARVLTGVSTPSTHGMSYLPNQPNTNTPFDSGQAGGICIIFYDTQAYPEYLITF